MYKILFFVFLSFSIFSAEKNCFENRSGLDIGSGATKFKIFKINICKAMAPELLFERQFAIQFKESLKTSSENKFSNSVIEEFDQAIKEVKSKNLEFNVSRFKAVATEAFRQASNGLEFVEKINKEHGISIQLINQDEEAMLGFKSAFSDSVSTKKKMVWDIGGGSMQMVLSEKGKIYKYLGKTASVSFKDLVLNNAKNEKNLTTPNPLSEQELKAAYKIAKNEAKNMPKEFRKRVTKNTLVVGVGGVFQFSLIGQLKLEDKFNLSQLKKLIKIRHQLTDDEIKSKYATTDITNLILVASFMEVLGIKNIKVKKANLTDALVLD